jgi:hypothetical protein
MPTGLFHADDDIVFAATHGRRWSAVDDDLPYSEVDWLEPELLRLLGGFMMAEHFPEGLRFRPYPIAHSGFVIDTEVLDLTAPGTAQAVKTALLATQHEPKWHGWRQERWSVGAKPAYLFDAEGEISVEDLPAYWRGISTADHVLMRGIQALVKSDMLAMHTEFMEEAITATFIAMESSFQLVRRHLQALGNPNPSAHDAGAWMYETFEKPMGIWAAEGLRYFEEFYHQRIQTVHPASRFGGVPYAPVMVDDWVHLRQALPHVFGYLVLGRHPGQFWTYAEEVRSARQ